MMYLVIDGQYAEEISPALIWTMAIITLVVTVGFYLLRSFGLYTMAKRRGFRNAYLAFIPCVWMYTACKLIGNVKTFGSTFERLALTFCIIFSVGQVLNFFYQFIFYFPVVGNYLAGNQLYIIMVSDEAYLSAYTGGMTHLVSNIYGVNVSNPYTNMGIAPQTITLILNIIYYITLFTDIAVLIITIFVYINLFRRYIPQHYILFSVLSIMGIFEPLLFAVRKKQAVNYNDYLRSRYNMWYANNNPYGGQVNNGAPQSPSTPFEEFAEKDEIDPGDPFANLGSGDSNKTNNDEDDFFN